MSVNQRIKILQDSIGKQRFFSNKIGINEKTLSSLYKEEANYPSFKIIEAVLKGFPSINARWLILGEGEMIESSEKVERNSEFTEGDMAALQRRVAILESDLQKLKEK